MRPVAVRFQSDAEVWKMNLTWKSRGGNSNPTPPLETRKQAASFFALSLKISAGYEVGFGILIHSLSLLSFASLLLRAPMLFSVVTGRLHGVHIGLCPWWSLWIGLFWRIRRALRSRSGCPRLDKFERDSGVVIRYGLRTGLVGFVPMAQLESCLHSKCNTEMIFSMRFDDINQHHGVTQQKKRTEITWNMRTYTDNESKMELNRMKWL